MDPVRSFGTAGWDRKISVNEVLKLVAVSVPSIESLGRAYTFGRRLLWCVQFGGR